MLTPQAKFQTAPVDKFTFARPRILVGDLLQDVKTLQNSILRFGLLSPIIVRRHNGRLFVVDGRKRLAAIRRLRFAGQLPRSLVNIPYTELKDLNTAESPTPALMSNRELYTTVTDAFKGGADTEQIAQDLYLSRRCISQVLTLSRLSARLRGLFFEKVINFDQARTYAAQPRHALQNAVFGALGPFAAADKIREYLENTAQHTTQAPDAQKSANVIRLAA